MKRTCWWILIGGSTVLLTACKSGGGHGPTEDTAHPLGDTTPAEVRFNMSRDGLPTQGENPPRGAMVSGKRRLDLFGEAINRLPKQIPINVIMFPMEGDPMASAAYWNVARVTGGAFISPSWDWP